jgi:diadenylate cyclase
VNELLREFDGLRALSSRDALIDALDVLLVAYLIYRLLMLVRGTRAWRIGVGILIFLFVLGISDRLGLKTLHWVLSQAMALGPVALVLLFLPELRQVTEGLGRLAPRLGGNEPRAEARTVEEIVAAVAELAAGSIGALIVIENGAELDEIATNGVLIDARVSAPLLVSIFYERNPLHDGAVIIRRDSILAAACRLPLSESSRLDQNVHMRHRAAVGVTESTDCLTIVVSEERGTISVASEGRLRRLSSHLDLRDILNRELRNEQGGERVRRTKARAKKKEMAAPVPTVAKEVTIADRT